MRPDEPQPVIAAQRYRPLCSRCGALTMLARIEPAGDPEYDLRTFECASCGNSDQLKIKFK